jgi:hypothetical protein
MWIFTALSSGILLWLVYLFVQKNRNQYSAILGLSVKIFAGVALGLIYKYHYQGGDTYQYYSEAGLLAKYLIAYPQEAISILFNTRALPELVHQLSFLDQPRALFFSKIISLIYLLSGGNYWLINISLSFANFMCVYVWVKELSRSYTNIYTRAALSFYFLPTFVFWTSGLLKESLGIGALMIVLAFCFKMIRTREYLSFKYWIIIIISGTLVWKLKYFYGAIAFPVLGTLLLFEFLRQKKKRIPVYMVLGFLFVGFFVISFAHDNLNFGRVLDVIYQNYLIGIGNSDGKSIEFYQLDGSLLGFIINLPLAMIFGLFRPLPFESTGLLPFMVGIENLVILILTLIGLLKVKFNFNYKDPVIWLSLVYILSLSVLLAFSTPNFGTLSRVKVGFWPLFVLLVLVLNQKKVRLSTI